MMKLRRWLSAASRRSRSVPILHVRKLGSKEIKKATDRFSMIMGSDSDGTIYRARFPDGLVVTIKKVKHEEQGKVTFPTEVQLLARLHHRHLVKLVGFSEGYERYLAYEHMENGSLRDWLRDPLKTPLNWRTRLQIAVDVAAALEYIYYFCDPPVYNVTINSNNVMLDHNFVAKVSNVVLDCNFSYNNYFIANHSKGLDFDVHFQLCCRPEANYELVEIIKRPSRVHLKRLTCLKNDFPKSYPHDLKGEKKVKLMKETGMRYFSLVC